MHMREFLFLCLRAFNTLTYSAQLATDRNQLPRSTDQSIECDAAVLANSSITSNMGPSH